MQTIVGGSLLLQYDEHSLQSWIVFTKESVCALAALSQDPFIISHLTTPHSHARFLGVDITTVIAFDIGPSVWLARFR